MMHFVYSYLMISNVQCEYELHSFMHYCLRIAAMDFNNCQRLTVSDQHISFYVDFGQLCLLLLNTPWKSHTETCVWGAEGLRGTGIQFGR